MRHKFAREVELTDYDYISSATGNAYFSGLTFETLWDCVANSSNGKEIDENVQAAIEAKEKLTKLL